MVEILVDEQPIDVEGINGVQNAVIPFGASYFEREENEKDPWGEEYSQIYRYTPFSVRVGVKPSLWASTVRTWSLIGISTQPP